jgi:hypothetical protein
MGILAYGRLGATHYFAPAYALSIIPALGLARRFGRYAPLAVAALVLAVWIPQRGVPNERPNSKDVPVAELAALERMLPPHAVALTPTLEALPDTLYAGLVESYVRWMPPYPFRTLPASTLSEWTMNVEHTRPRYFVSPGPLTSAMFGDYTVSLASAHRIGPRYVVYRLVSGPGVSTPLPSSPPAGAPEIAP